ncbi:MAG TPA: tRNA uridine-5-carboxymethylaminomethyl(34) synthesis GTPase MnmE [Usitatibacter sp.]|nr:tRNA uridine-5-carboxymethylaminomethyl(34) synthesis GTPase MnmE [Usitatibacter sp.]
MTAGGDTIAAIATPAGRGGIGVVRVSGPRVCRIAEGVLGRVPAPRLATLAAFRDAHGEAIDRGIALFFPAPHSYTGEDILELQGHGGPVVMLELVRRCVALGARLAEPGEFTRRAFLNERMDLAQAEAVADLIDAASVEAARSASRSLSGVFSARIHALSDALLHLRMHVEACIDFPEEEIDPADRSRQAAWLEALRADFDRLLEEARQGAVLREGLVVVLAGRPNVGKSSLLNRLAGEDVAIVTPLAGTTRDYVRASISIEGVPIHLVDTAGLRESDDVIERMGVERSWRALQSAGAALFVEEAQGELPEDEALRARLPQGLAFARVVNKIDLADGRPGRSEGPETVIRLSARTGEGVADLRGWLLEVAGWKPHGEGLFIARERHVRGLEAAKDALERAAGAQAFEIAAEELRLGHLALGSIVGEVSADDLLGEIFSRFCIGK